ncbi:GDP-6-deoxy-D-lyxo-4-hexulose reductase [Dyella thiooxydans]|uniref:GDP-6-deoxy-D-lyxo-4-hexulose reductase n=2 Tax=Dyella thiooxydans TaxID=445710 RepID=A0A160N551_9GAMM|nr:GDP-6-deoxy-D-lyxo-4-hexulose reductase [Dyella thiooxydans]
MARPRALLTGRTGFTGSYVARELEQAGYEVIGLANHLRDDDGHTIRANLLDRDAVAQAVAEADADVVLHLAAVAFVAHGDVDEMYRVNVVGTRNLLEALAGAQKRPELVVLASSANVYGNAEVDPITEDTPPAPANDYAVSKLAMEYMARLWMDRLPITVTRPFNYTGVGQSTQFLIPKIVDHFRRGERVIELGNAGISRDFGDVRDVARAYKAIVRAKPVGRTLNLCTGVAHSLQDVLEMMADAAGYHIEVKVNPAFVRDNEVHRLVGANQRLRELAGITEFHMLRETLAWMYSS